jgi:hypothetical protein
VRRKGTKDKSRQTRPRRQRDASSSVAHVVRQAEPDLVVFVSSRIDVEMREHRDAVIAKIRSIPITRDWAFEYAPASSQEPEESYLSKVRACDIFILLLGSDYSQWVSREYQVAMQTGKPILAFVFAAAKSAQQEEFVHSLDKIVKWAPYTNADELQDLVYNSVLDELIRRFRTTLRQSDKPKLIEKLPMNIRKLEDISGYVIIGLDEGEIGKILFEPFGGATPPEDLKKLNPSMEPVYFDNLTEMQEVFVAIKNAATRTRTAVGDQQKAFLRELKREASEIASRFIVRQRSKKPGAQISVPGLKYFIWGMAPDIARMMRVMRPQEIISGAKTIERTKNEYFFIDANYLVKVFAEIYEAGQKAAGDDEEFLRLLLAGAMRLHFLGDSDDDVEAQPEH